ncbi:hypothetical protein [Candidatus Cardinium hertigii]|uniref:Uncharacterized protein n=1 Tax=Candidatus Cardinium hertigii TaxID=247481 RepID=A0A2Z3LHW5_9BACT|nr:hypothetical protein [Candidatus Cardinium hertigii]AWN82105.1 hypothetical protein DK880_00799 [Candidatus Cardinium hertigii]
MQNKIMQLGRYGVMVVCIPTFIGCGKLSNQLGMQSGGKGSPSVVAKNVSPAKSQSRLQRKSKDSTGQAINPKSLLVTALLLAQIRLGCNQDLVQNGSSTTNECEQNIKKLQHMRMHEAFRRSRAHHDLSMCEAKLKNESEAHNTIKKEMDVKKVIIEDLVSIIERKRGKDLSMCEQKLKNESEAHSARKKEMDVQKMMIQDLASIEREQGKALSMCEEKLKNESEAHSARKKEMESELARRVNFLFLIENSLNQCLTKEQQYLKEKEKLEKAVQAAEVKARERREMRHKRFTRGKH